MKVQVRWFGRSGAGLWSLGGLVASILLTILFLQACSSGDWSKEAVAQTEVDGDRIIAALETFHRDRSDYPERLDQLVPKYIDAIVPPKAGNQTWKYATGHERWSDRKNYVLKVDGYDSHEPTMWRESGASHWSSDSK